MFIKATITAVDPIRGVCKCKRDNDAFPLINIPWASPVGEKAKTPSVGDRVMIWRDGNDMIITHSFPGPSSYTAAGAVRPSITDGAFLSPSIDTSSVSGSTFAKDAPVDVIPGDNVMRTRGGAVVAALLGGGVLLKAGPCVQVFMTRVDDLLRTVCRNFEHFSEAKSEVEVVVEDRLYSYVCSYLTLAKNRNDQPSHELITGDIALALDRKLDYILGNDPPAGDDRVRLERVLEASEDTTSFPFSSTLTTTGKETNVSTDGATTTTANHEPTVWQLTYVDGTNTNTITVTDTIRLKALGGEEASILLNPDGTITIKGTQLLADVPESTFNGNVTINENLTVLQNTTVTAALAVLGTGVSGTAASIAGSISLDGTVTVESGGDIAFAAVPGLTFLTHKHPAGTPKTGTPTT